MAISSDTAALQAEIRQLAVLMRQQITAQSALAQSTLHVADSFDDVTDLAHDDAKRLKQSLNIKRRLNEEERDLLEQYQQAQRRVLAEEQKIEKYKKAMADAEAQRQRGVLSQREFDKKKLEFEQRIQDHTNRKARLETEASTAADKFKKAVGGLSDKFYMLIGILGSLGGNLLNFNKKFMEATSKSAGVIEETTGNFDQGMGHWLMALNATGVESAKMIEMMAGSRQMVNALGGMTKTVHTAEDAIKQTYGIYGSLEEAWKQNLNVMTGFANKGVKPTSEALKAYNDDLDYLARQTGMSGDAMNAMINSIVDDTDSITILRAAREDEREAILANQRALLQNNIALGMTAKQAEEASKMLNKMVAQKPLDRLKQAAKARALGYALGLGAESERAAVGIQKGKLATAQERADIMAFGTAVTNISDQAAQQGLGQELFVSELLAKLDFDSYFGAGSPFSTTLADTNKSQLNLEAQYKSSSDSIIVSVNYIADIASQMVSALFDGTILWGAILDATRNISTVFEFVMDGVKVVLSGVLDSLSFIGNTLKFLGDPIGVMSGKVETFDTSRLEKALEPSSKAVIDSKTTDAIVQNATTQKAIMVEQAAEQKKKQDEMEKVRAKLGVSMEDKNTGGMAKEVTTAAQPVKIIPNPITEGTDNVHRTKADAVQQNHTNLLSAQVTKIDTQIAMMTQSNDSLKIIADTVPKLLDIADKQLAATLMNEQQRYTMASRMRGESAKFSADYSYAV